VGLAALVLGGCGFMSAPLGGGAGGGKAPVKRISVTAPYTVSETVQPGTTFTPSGPGTFAVGNQVVKGTFNSTLPFKIDPVPRKKKKAAAAGGGFRSVSGSFVSKLAGTFNAMTQTGTFSGVKVIRFGQGKLGDACLTWNSTVSNNGNTENGSFNLVGGTKLAATARMTGSYTGTKTQTGVNATVTGTVTVSGKVGKPAKGLTSECQALAPQL
jgi:hypothetical protein